MAGARVEAVDFEAASQALLSLGTQVQRLANHPAIAVGDRTQQILDSIQRIEESQRLTNENIRRIEENIRRVEENQRVANENIQRIEETQQLASGNLAQLTQTMASVENRVIVLDKVSFARALNSSSNKSENIIYAPVRPNGEAVVDFPPTLGELKRLTSNGLLEWLDIYEIQIASNTKEERLKALMRHIGLSGA